jgi:hypothetical protein
MRFLLIVTIAFGVTPLVASSSAQTISSKEQEAIKATCAWRVQANGPADYYNCVSQKTQALQSTSRPDLSAISPSDRNGIESACAWRWQANGPADYYQCVDSKAKQLRITSEPDVSGIPSSDLEAIKSTCAWRRQANGPADYYQCVDSKAKQLRATTSGPAGAGTIRSTPREQSLTQSQTNTSAVVPSNQSSPENKRLRYFLGTWKLTGNVKSSPFGPAGKMTGTQRNEIAPDGSSISSKWEEQRPTGRSNGQATYSYDSAQNVYRYHGSSDDGEVEDSVGSIEGNNWAWTSNLSTPSGAPAKGRFTLEVISPSAYNFKFEIALQGDAWITVMEGNAEQSR